MHNANESVVANILRSINLEYDANNPDRISHFYPTSKSIILINSVFNGERERAFFITAPYGSGKSLTAAYILQAAENTLQARSTLIELSQRVQEMSPKLGELLAHRIDSNNKALVIAISGYKDSLISAMEEGVELSLYRHGIQLGDWKNTVSRVSIKTFLESLIVLLKALKNRGFDKVIFLWDEFGMHIESLISEGKISMLHEIQTLAEFASRAKTVPLTVGLILHRNLMEYTKKSTQSIQSEWKKIEGRFRTIQYIDTSKELYCLFSKFFIHTLHNVEIDVRQIEQLAQTSKDIGMFRDFSVFELTELLKSTYPMEPAALYHLPYIASKVAQHERTLFTFLSTVQTDETVSVDLLYDYFSDAMSMDNSIGGTYHYWLESQSAISKASTVSEVKAIKTITILSIGLSGERQKISLEYLKFALKGYTKPTSEVSKTIQGLIKKKILLYRKNVDSVMLWHGTDADINARLEEEKNKQESSFEFVHFLTMEIEPVHWKPIKYNNKYYIQRYFIGKYLDSQGLKQELALLRTMESEFLEPGEDARMYYLLPKNEIEKASMISDIQKYDEHKQILWAIPQKIPNVFETALEVYCYYQLQSNAELVKSDPLILTELQQLSDDATDYLQNIVSQTFSPSQNGPHYIWNGTERAINSIREFRIFISDIMEDIFYKTPAFNSEMINRKNPRSNLKTARRKLLIRIMEGTGKENLGLEGFTPDISMYRTLIANTGLYRKKHDTWAFVHSEEIDDLGLREVWKHLEEFFINPQQNKQFTDLVCELQQPPFGIRKGVIPVLVSAAMRAFPSIITIKNKKGEYLIDILPSVIEDICDNPENYRIQVHVLSTEQKNLLRGVYELFAPERNVSIREMDALRKCYNAIELWKHELPKNALQTRQVSPQTQKFQEVIIRYSDPADLLFVKFPSITECTVPKDIISELKKFKVELENLVQTYHSQAVIAIKQSIHGSLGKNVQESLKEWANFFPQSVIELIPDQSRITFLKNAKRAFKSEGHVINTLSVLLTGLPLNKWDDSTLVDFSRKIQENISTCEDILLQLSDRMNNETAKRAIQDLAGKRLKQMYEKLEQAIGKEKAREQYISIIKEE